MKNAINIFTICVLAGLSACEDVFNITPVPATTPSAYTANFLLVNATPDAPALDLYINNLAVGSSVEAGEAQDGYNTVPITSNAVIANTNIRSSASTGNIGGVLGSSNLIYRATSTTTNNFTAANGASYTLFAVDSIDRPKPFRTLNALGLGDVTYYSSQSSFTAAKIVGVGDTTIYLNVANFGVDDEPSDAFASANSIIAFNLVKKYNANVAPTFMTPIGIVPLGSSDVGGIRYYLWPDVFATFTVPQSTTRAAFRVLNASPNSGALRVRLDWVSGPGADVTIPVNAAGVQYIMSNGGGFTPSVGSRTQASAASFAVNGTADTAPGGDPNFYNVEVIDAGNNVLATVSTPNNTNVTFGGNANPSSNYTFVISGLVGGTGSEALKVTVVEHN